MTNFQRMMVYYRRYRVKLFNGCLCVLLSAVVGLAAPVFVGRAIDELQRELTREKLMTYALIVLAIALVKGFFLYLQRMILVAMSRDIENDLRNDYYKHLQRLPLAFYHQFRTGDLMARATNDLSAVRML
ncbi:MAG: ABC transporter ATP-binding protein, partial [Blastocatellia bacterium]|nr:ABC transporter ATP-binding protein [Blastocatellia bacterium]